jgi:hypothetical protein
MNWLAANPYAVAAMWAGAAALAVWLYLHTRQPLRRRVATLRFWNSVQPVAQPRRRRIREPWALLAQLLFLLLLIVALADPHLGATSEGRSVVIVLDTSIWSRAQVPGAAPWMDDVHREAQRVLSGLPAGDPVLLMPAEADAPSIMPFTTDRAALQRAILATRASSGIADLPRSLKIGWDALAGANRGLLIYVGPGMLDERQAQELDAFRQQVQTEDTRADRLQFLVRLVGGAAPLQNRGITRLALRRDATQPDRWHLLTQVKNYNDTEAHVTLKLSVNGQGFVERAMSPGPGELDNVENEFVWAQGGLLQADITPSDTLDSDNHAAVIVPAFHPVRVALFTTDSSFAKNVASVLSSNPYLETETESPGSNPKNKPDVAIYQGMNLADQPAYDSIWFLSGNQGAKSPLLRVTDWNSQHPAVRWVRSHDVNVRNLAALRVLPNDTVLATAGGNPPVPLIVAREQQGHRLVIVGFDPKDSNFQLQSAFPLLMAGSIEWMTRPVEEVADSFSVGELSIPGPATRIVGPSGKDVPFAREGANVHLLATETGVYRLLGPGGETRIAVNTPLLPAQRLKPTALEAAAPESEPPLEVRLTLWRWLLVLAVVALFLEWWLYYTGTRKRQLAENLAKSEIPNLGSYAGPSSE